MNDANKIEEMVDRTLEIGASIEKIQTPPFFKEKVLNRLRQRQELVKEERLIGWFTPKYQAAALICFIIVNAYALVWYTSDNYDENVENFAEVYGISDGDETSYFNLN